MVRVLTELSIFFFQAEDGIRDYKVTGVQTCALPIFVGAEREELRRRGDLPRRECRPRYLDHRADRHLTCTGLGDDTLGLATYRLQLLHGAHERHHDLRDRKSVG